MTQGSTDKVFTMSKMASVQLPMTTLASLPMEQLSLQTLKQARHRTAAIFLTTGLGGISLGADRVPTAERENSYAAI